MAIVDKFKMETKDSDYTVIEGDDADQLILDIAQALDAARRETWQAAATECETRKENCIVALRNDMPLRELHEWRYKRDLLGYLVEHFRAKATAQADKEA